MVSELASIVDAEGLDSVLVMLEQICIDNQQNDEDNRLFWKKAAVNLRKLAEKLS